MALKITKKDHVLGPETAEHTLVEYADYQCPGCAEAAPIVARLGKHFGDRLRIVFRNFPLEQHEYAEVAAETAEFAAAQGKFWEMHDLLFKEQKRFADGLFPKLAEKIGLDGEALSQALDEGTYTPKVQGDLQSGEKAGVAGTPSFFVDGKIYEGSYEFEALVEALG